MIVFHEGLPGSGKSYEAVARRLVPWLKEGRVVQARVNGLDYDKLAQLAGITSERCRELLEVIADDKDKVRAIATWAKQNAAIIVDEAAGTWGNRFKMDDATADWIKEHRHHGNDVVLMDQDLRDLHAIWRRRVEFKVCFLKLTAFGSSKRYSVSTWRHKGGDEFVKVGTQVHKYDPTFFGSYASHVSDDVKTDDYQDDRANALKHPLIRFGVPAALLVAIWGLWTAWGFFHAKPPEKNAASGPPAASTPHQVATAAPVPKPAAPLPAPKPDERTPQEKLLAGLSERYRIRLAGMIASPTRVQGVVEWIDAGVRVVHRMTLDELRNLGAAVAVTGDQAVMVQVGAWSDIATSWPLDDPLARASQTQLAAMRPATDPAGLPAGPAPGAGLSSLGGSAPVAPARQAEPAGDLNVRPTRTVVAPPKA